MKYYISFLLFLFSLPLFAQNENDRIIFDVMQDEMKRNQAELSLPGFPQPFYLSYAFCMSEQFDISAVLGSVVGSYYFPNKSVGSVRAILGDYQNSSDSRYTGQFTLLGMPGEADYNAIRRNFWLGTDVAYKTSLREMSAKQAHLKANPLPENEAQLADMSKLSPVTSILEHKPFQYEIEKLEELAREISAIFKDYKDIFNSGAYISGFDMDIYKYTSEDIKLKTPQSMVNFVVQASIRTEDGVKIEDAYSVVVARPQDLPSTEELKKKVKEFADNLVSLKNAPKIDEFYSGPVLFENAASSVIFINNLLNQRGLFAYRKPSAGQRDGMKTLEDRMGKKIIDNRVSVKNYSTLDKYNGTSLLGAYQIDAEGVTPEKELVLVEKGILKNFLNGSVPTLKAPVSTGSSRYLLTNANIAYVTAPGTIHIAVDKGIRPDKMKKALIKAAKEEGVDYAYIVRKFAGPASLIYRVNLKDGSETQVRFGDISNIDLAKLKRVLEISNKENVMNYILNRQVPSSLIYPSSILIEDVEISKTVVKPEKEPVLQFPLQREK